MNKTGKAVQHGVIFEFPRAMIWRSCPLGRDTVESGRNLSALWMNLILLSSRQNKGDSRFFRNVGEFTPDCTASQCGNFRYA